MTRPRFALALRHPLALAAVLALTLMGLLSSPGSALAGFSGQQEGAWGEFGTAPGQLFDPGSMGVDPVDGSVFVTSYPSDFSTTIIKKFSEAGQFEGSVELPGLEYVGIAVDPNNERFYVLEDPAEAGGFEARKILAFESNQSGELVAASPAELPLPAFGSAAALRNPREIVFDPHSQDLVVVAENEAGEAVLQRIGTAGAGSIGQAWVDTGHTVDTTSFAIAIDAAGVTYVMSGNGAQEVSAETLPIAFTAASTPTSLPGVTTAATALVAGSDFEAVIPQGGVGWGPQLAVSTAADGEDTLYWKAADSFSGPAPGNIFVVGYSVGGEVQTVAFGGGAAEGHCRIQTNATALAFGRNGDLVTFDQGQEVLSLSELPGWFPIVSRFGPGGSDCPAPAAAIKLTGEGGTQVSDGGSVAEGARVVLDGSESELNGNTLEGVGWKIEGPNGTTTEDRQKAAHVFTAPGTYKIRLGLKTLNVGLGGNFGATDALVVTAGSGVTEFPLSVGTTGAGSAALECDTGAGFGPCASTYPKGEEIIIEATPTAGAEVLEWNGCTSTAGNECAIESLTASTTVNALIGKAVALHLSSSGTGSGGFGCAVGGGAVGGCATKYPEGAEVTVSAVPAAGSEFAGWGGACAGTAACEVTMDGEETVTATFNKVATTGGGSTGGGSTGGGSGNTGTDTTSGGGSVGIVTHPGGGGETRKTPAQIAKEKRAKALVQCKKLHGNAKTQCVKKANLIGKPKPKHKATKDKKKH